MAELNKLIKKLHTIYESFKERYINFRYKGIIGICLIFAFITMILFVERSGIQYNYEARELALLPENVSISKSEALKNAKKDMLVIWNSEREESLTLYKQFKVILTDMKLGCSFVDASKEKDFDYSKYKGVIVLLNDLTPLGHSVFDLCEYVHKGNDVLLAMTLEKGPYSSVVENRLGIIDSSYSNARVENIFIDKDFMIGGGRGFDIDDGFDSARALRLKSKNVKLHAWTNDDRKLPLIWEAGYGKGNFIVDNFGLYEKVMRGFYAASISLMGDACVYPVINGSTFYLDDFPSQIPSGNSEYINRDYGTSIRDFYVNIWWPDMMNFADKYGIKYTGLAIECYDDAVDGSTPTEPDEGTFLSFGNMLMRQGGEIGYHGYNHQPLCLGNVDYKGEFEYKTWQSTSAMKSAFDELVDFCDKLFPEVDMNVYVPPSNILSKEGRNFLKKNYPQIKTISGIYFEDAKVEASCVQEYDVGKDGIIDQPRIVSGCKMDNFMKLACISELNFHFINNHFTHPDDALDPERGAKLGWEKLTEHFDMYLDWLYTSAPCLRNFTGSEMSAAVQRFASVGVDTKYSKDKMTINISNFYDEASLMIRFNEKKPKKAHGGKLTHITGDLYLLEAYEDSVEILFDK